MKKLLLLLLPIVSYSQDYKRTFNWYFGDSAGISFATNPPTPLSNGKMFTDEGCASISDTNGNLLFYTNGEKVWNKNHEIMEMGDSLLGSIDATQSSIIIPQPGVDSIYNIFTTPTKGLGGLRYSIVDMSANGGLGKVISRNILLQSPVCEKLTATHHQNGKDIWVVAHGFKDPGKDNLFYSYLITEKGLVNCPILTNIGAEHYKYDMALYNAQGAMKFSRDGKRLAITVYNELQNYIELFDFNKNTGAIFNPIRINNIFLPYGLEFSPNGKRLYVTNRSNHLYQYNLDLSTEAAINNSRTELYWPGFNTPAIYHGNMQLAANGKVYIALKDSNFLSVVDSPNAIGINCTFNFRILKLSNGATSKSGLPNYITSYFDSDESDFLYQFICSSQTVYFQSKLKTTPSFIYWQIKKLSNGFLTTYSPPTINHQFNDSGLYEVQLITDSDTVTKTIFIDAPILPKTDTLGCGVDSVVLNIPSSYRCLQWRDTSLQLNTRTIKSNGVYTIQGYNSHGCLITDSIKILFSATPLQPVITKVSDSLYSSTAFSYQWFLNDTALFNANTQSIKPTKAGLYKVIITDSNRCSNVSNAYSSNVSTDEVRSTANISVYPNPAITLLFIEADSESDFSLTNINGQLLLSEKLKRGRNTLNVSPFAKGIYFIQVKTNNTTYHQKIIIQ